MVAAAAVVAPEAAAAPAVGYTGSGSRHLLTSESAVGVGVGVVVAVVVVAVRASWGILLAGRHTDQEAAAVRDVAAAQDAAAARDAAVEQEPCASAHVDSQQQDHTAPARAGAAVVAERKPEESSVRYL